MNIIKMVTGFATPMIASKVAGALGLPEGVVRKIVSVAVPVVLAAVMKRGSAPGGTEALGGAFANMGENPLETLGSALGGDASRVQAASKSGGDLLSSILGGGVADTLVSKLAGYGGVEPKSAAPLLGLVGSMALGGLKKTADDQGLDAAGVMKLLNQEKGDIAAAIPADFMKSLEGTGLLGDFAAATPAAAAAARPAAAPPRAAPKAPPAPVKSSGGWSKWVIGLAVLAILAWLLTQFMGGPAEAPAPVVETPAEAPAETTAAPAETTAAPIPAAEAPEVGEGIDITASMQEMLDRITGSLGSITDLASAEAALPTLTEADTALGDMSAAVEALPAEARTSLHSVIVSALPAIKVAADKLTADSAIGPVVKPAVDGIVAKLEAYAG